MTPLRLSSTELALVRYIAEGRTNHYIARQCGLTPHGAKHLIDKVLTRSKARSRTHLVTLAFAARQLWVDLNGDIQTRTSTAARLDAINPLPRELGGAS
jgi:DNA-binding CsgD family transcriptional regulator